MNRIPSLRHSFFHARAVLRARFAALPSWRRAHVGLVSSDLEAPRDADLLQLLQDTSLTRNAEETLARQEYMRIRSEPGAGAELPDYDEALARGWFRTIEGSVVPAGALRDYYHQHDVSYAEALRSFVYWLSEVRYHIAQPGTHASAGSFEDYLVAGAESAHKPPVQSRPGLRRDFGMTRHQSISQRGRCVGKCSIGSP